jgi:hypothetical protein
MKRAKSLFLFLLFLACLLVFTLMLAPLFMKDLVPSFSFILPQIIIFYYIDLTHIDSVFPTFNFTAPRYSFVYDSRNWYADILYFYSVPLDTNEKVKGV